ncbi:MULTISPECIES: PRC and DUF2382 domain-containing protein [unclassified Streptomyces]|uniref:PRC and DUF2382 domain-containing protein n=1 Tax=unclassified Streptomyces TaxID=2593676 RepID=UPI000DB9F374|nr:MULTISPECIES: PRC and DUF2382 domain-containing protein [unclassified Streptomyces]MYT75109.1 DUF2382 domain-containing protein [Streptomyces sp. SID8367]RAJ77066.1 uncharacterized protein (TIGR02271 family) [Streptomyces sp. PsTaAH-137]
MTQGEINNPDALVGLTAYDRTGEKIGSVERVYLDDRTGKPGWATVKTGLFGMKETFVPLSGASRTDERLQVMYTKEAVKDAPRVDADQHLSEAEQQELYAHYGLTRPTAGTGGNRPERPAAAPDLRGTAGAAGAAGAASGYATGESTGRHAAGAREPAMRGAADVPEKETETELIRSEERLRVGVENQEVGHAHLRKVVETEDVTTSVPLSHEEVRVVREPITEADAKRATIGEAETEVTLHAERAVVSKETVPVERVRLETEKVTETKEVSDTVRKERIEYDDPKSERGMPGEGKSGRGGPRH